MSKTLARSRSSAGVSRSKSRVPRPRRFKDSATRRLRGLWRLLPLPWAKITRPPAARGTLRCPGRARLPIRTATSSSRSPGPRPAPAGRSGRAAARSRSASTLRRWSGRNPGTTGPPRRPARGPPRTRTRRRGWPGARWTGGRPPGWPTPPVWPRGPGPRGTPPGPSTRGDPVVDHDDGPAGERTRGRPRRKRRTRSLELGPLPALDGGELGLGDPGLGHHLVVDDEHPSLAERPHRQFGLEGDPKLAHDQDVERGVQGQGHLVGHGNPAPGEADDDHVVRLQVDQRRGQLAAASCGH